ncbi:MAG: RidA family protein [Cyanobacteria bacterium P01_H01_bin.119]
MSKRRYHNPDALHKNPAFSQGVSVPSTARTIYVGGQNAIAADGSLVGGDDLAAQTMKSLQNLQTILADAGATIHDVVKWNILILAGQPANEGFEAFKSVWGQDANPPAITIAFVSGFAVPGALVEIDAIAVIDVDEH